MKHSYMSRRIRLGDLLVGSYFQHLGVKYKILSRDGSKVKCLDMRIMRPLPRPFPADLVVYH